MQSHFDTISAPITPPGRGAVAAIRVSGPEAWSIARKVFPSLPIDPQARYAYYGSFANDDDGLTILFEEAKSYTGESSAEFFLHGSTISLEQILTLCQEQGARMAEPGEFTQRAFLNGRIDLTQAEAVAETVDAQSEIGLRAAHRQRSGALKRDLAPIRSAIDEAAVMLEAQIDFSDDVGPLDLTHFKRLLTSALAELKDVQRHSIGAEQARNGFRIVLLGKPNAGKSSLFNRLLGNERAIVTPVPGTTRDTLEYPLNLSGLSVLLVDTAGLRENPDQIEALGIERSYAATAEADLVLYLSDVTQSLDKAESTLIDELGSKCLTIGTKADLIDGPTNFSPAISAITGQGLEQLNHTIKAKLASASIELPYLLNKRHDTALTSAAASVTEAIDASEEELPADLVLSPLLEARSRLASIVGEAVSDDLLHDVFAKFCIGK